jgi:hypothetical protein
MISIVFTRLGDAGPSGSADLARRCPAGADLSGDWILTLRPAAFVGLFAILLPPLFGLHAFLGLYVFLRFENKTSSRPCQAMSNSSTFSAMSNASTSTKKLCSRCCQFADEAFDMAEQSHLLWLGAPIVWSYCCRQAKPIAQPLGCVVIYPATTVGTNVKRNDAFFSSCERSARDENKKQRPRSPFRLISAFNFKTAWPAQANESSS